MAYSLDLMCIRNRGSYPHGRFLTATRNEGEADHAYFFKKSKDSESDDVVFVGGDGTMLIRGSQPAQIEMHIDHGNTGNYRIIGAGSVTHGELVSVISQSDLVIVVQIDASEDLVSLDLYVEVEDLAPKHAGTFYCDPGVINLP